MAWEQAKPSDIFNKRLYSLMVARGLSSADDLADKAQVSSKTIWNMLHGRYSPRVDTAQRVARALGTNLDAIYPISDLR